MCVLNGINIFEGAGRRHETGRACVTEAAPTVQGHLPGREQAGGRIHGLGQHW
jgi:hypothetical protein